MKSLEVVKNVLKVYEMDGSTFGLLYVEDLKEIKQDLEVLEIINKKDVDIRELKLLCFGILGNGIGTIEDTLKVYNTPRIPKCQLTMEELLKLKQWLEENNEKDKV